MDVHNSVHNVSVQALVGSGLVGLVSLLFIISAYCCFYGIVILMLQHLFPG